MADNLPRVKVANATVWHLACGWTWFQTFQSTPPRRVRGIWAPSAG